MPGEDHSFGTVLVEDVFRRAGGMTDSRHAVRLRPSCSRASRGRNTTLSA